VVNFNVNGANEMEDELEHILEKYKAAGKILVEVREAALELVKPGNRLLDVAEFVESGIRDRGGEPAFPCNISRNEEAAHATPSIDDGIWTRRPREVRYRRSHRWLYRRQCCDCGFEW